VSCGNGVVSAGEACDDGNTSASDGCATDCTTVEHGYTCPTAGVLCVSVCGDGIKVSTEDCDDGDLTPGDWSSPTVLSTGRAYSSRRDHVPCRFGSLLRRVAAVGSAESPNHRLPSN